MTAFSHKPQVLLAAIIACATFCGQFGYAAPAFAAGGQVKTSGLPLPRYVSLKSSRVNMRVGPGRGYSIDWMYLKRGLPVEIILEYDTWRKVRDSEGNEGWILQALLSGDRTAIIAPWQPSGEMVELRAEPAPSARVVAMIEPGVVAPVSACLDGWCELKVAGATGFVSQKQVWGVYPDESFEK